MTVTNKHAKIYVAGHRGMVGSALVRLLQTKGCHNLIVKTREELDLTNQTKVHRFLDEEKPDFIFLAAARVGGIHANNTFRADFIYENLVIETNIIHAAWKAGVNRLLFLGSSCIYPRDCPQPIREEYLLTGPLEQTNEPYALAKIAGIKLCESYNRQYGTSYVSVMPTNLYGPNDTYDLLESHVLPALIRKAHEAKLKGEKSLSVWGTGTPKREFLYVDDMAAASVFVMNLDKSTYDQHTEPMQSHINVGFGSDMTIAELAKAVGAVVGYQGVISFDATKPDGAPRKWMDSSRLNKLGWKAQVDIGRGLKSTYEQFCSSQP